MAYANFKSTVSIASLAALVAIGLGSPKASAVITYQGCCTTTQINDEGCWEWTGNGDDPNYPAGVEFCSCDAIAPGGGGANPIDLTAAPESSVVDALVLASSAAEALNAGNLNPGDLDKLLVLLDQLSTREASECTASPADSEAKSTAVSTR